MQQAQCRFQKRFSEQQIRQRPSEAVKQCLKGMLKQFSNKDMLMQSVIRFKHMQQSLSNIKRRKKYLIIQTNQRKAGIFDDFSWKLKPKLRNQEEPRLKKLLQFVNQSKELFDNKYYADGLLPNKPIKTEHIVNNSKEGKKDRIIAKLKIIESSTRTHLQTEPVQVLQKPMTNPRVNLVPSRNYKNNVNEQDKNSSQSKHSPLNRRNPNFSEGYSLSISPIKTRTIIPTSFCKRNQSHANSVVAHLRKKILLNTFAVQGWQIKADEDAE